MSDTKCGATAPEMRVIALGAKDVAYARARLAESGFVVVESVLKRPAEHYEAVCGEIANMCDGCDVLHFTSERGTTRSLKWFRTVAEQRVRLDVFHQRTQLALSEVPELVDMVAQITGVVPRFALREGYFVRACDDLNHLHMRTFDDSDEMVSYDGGGDADGVYTADYRAYVTLSMHKRHRYGMFEVVSRDNIMQDAAARHHAPPASTYEQARDIVWARSHRRHQDPRAVTWQPRRAGEFEPPTIRRVSIAAGSLIIVRADTLHRLSEPHNQTMGDAKLVVPLTYLAASQQNARWLVERQLPAYLTNTNPFTRTEATNLETRTHAQPYAFNALGRWLGGLAPMPPSALPPVADERRARRCRELVATFSARRLRPAAAGARTATDDRPPASE